MRNHWTEHAAALAAAYLQGDGALRFAVVTRALLAHLRLLGPTPARVLDIGGGQARQAVQLAQAGHEVTLLDIDPVMLNAAAEVLAAEPADVRQRVRLVQGPGEEAATRVGGGFDLVCCHSVLMYLENPMPLLSALVQATRPSGLLSVLSLNTDAVAMRAGLQGHWQEAVDGLKMGCEAGAAYLPTSDPPLREVRACLEAQGAPMLAWYGVGIFTDHLSGAVVAPDPQLVIEAEWLAGLKDPYRGVARCFHLVARKG